MSFSTEFSHFVFECGLERTGTLGGALAFMVHLKIDGLITIFEGTCSYDDLFTGYLKVIHIFTVQ